MSSDAGYRLNKVIPTEGGIVGPIETSLENEIYEIIARQDLNYGSWSYVSTDVLDKNGNHLFSFGKEFWAESGYDWAEKVTKYSAKVLLKEKGSYLFKFSAENSGIRNKNIKVAIRKKMASGIPHMIAGIFSLILGVILYFFFGANRLVK